MSTPPPEKTSILSEILQFAVALAVILVARTLIAAPYYVPSGSMEPTLQIGDEIVSTKYPYGYSRVSTPLDLPASVTGRLFEKLPARGDIVVFRPPSHPDQTWVKRVIGLPGDQIQMQAGKLSINGVELPLRADGDDSVEIEDGRRIPAVRLIETLPDGHEHAIVKLRWNGPMNDTEVYTVPPGCLFMMGDDRDNSDDSRVPAEAGGAGFVPIDNLVGRADFILGSWDFPSVHGIPEWLGGLRWSRFFTKLH